MSSRNEIDLSQSASSPDFSQPQVNYSIIIVNYNGEKYLQDCLQSVQDNSPAGGEVVLVDNASVDNSIEFVRQHFPDVRIITSKDNLGFGGGNNLGVSNAHGEYMIFLNQDTVAQEGWVEPLLETLKVEPDVGMVTSRLVLMSNPHIINTCGNDSHYTGLTLCRGMGQLSESYNTAANVSAVSGAAFAMRKADFERLGGFDSVFFMYMEDTDLSWRVQLAGMQCRYVPDSIVLHDYELRFGKNKILYQEYNRYVMLLKNFRWATMLVLFPALLASEIISWAFVLLQDRKSIMNKFRAYAKVAQNWNAIKQGRQRTREVRTATDRKLLQSLVDRIDFAQTGETVGTKVASAVFNPFFALYRRFALLMIRW